MMCATCNLSSEARGRIHHRKVVDTVNGDAFVRRSAKTRMIQSAVRRAAGAIPISWWVMERRIMS